MPGAHKRRYGRGRGVQWGEVQHLGYVSVYAVHN